MYIKDNKINVKNRLVVMLVTLRDHEMGGMVNSVFINDQPDVTCTKLTNSRIRDVIMLINQIFSKQPIIFIITSVI